jgi:hypothetical protein
MAEPIRIEHPVYLHDGEVAFDAVRAVNRHERVVCIENAGAFTVPMSAVHDVHDAKVVLDSSKLDKQTLNAINRAHTAEDGEDHPPVDG